MGRQSTITALPEDVRRFLERALTEQGFSGYEALEALMRDKGYNISKSAIHRYGQKIERKFEKIKAATDAARIITQGAADESDDRSAAVLAMIQSQTFDIMLNLSEVEDVEDPGERLRLLSAAGRSMADMTRSSLAIKRHQRDVSERLQALEDDARTGKRALDAETLRIVREEIYGA
jgi:hypothetical protein